MKSRYKSKIFIYLLYIILITISIIYLIYFFKLKLEARKESNLLNTIKLEENNTTENEVLTVEINEQNVTERMLKVRELKKENPDIVGWIEIEGTNISYPVLQGDNNEYYLNHNYKNEKTANGSIFLNKDFDLNLPSTNLLIYGHNMKNGEMFTDLLKYSSETYYKSHPIIRFTTENDDSEYEIFSVFRSKVFYKSETNVFRYYNFINAENEEEYNDFVENAKRVSLYDTNITPNYKENLITLITCSYHIEDGRFVVIGRKK